MKLTYGPYMGEYQSTSVITDYNDLPEVGEKGVLYVITEGEYANQIFRYDETTNEYYSLSANYSDITLIDGGGADG